MKHAGSNMLRGEEIGHIVDDLIETVEKEVQAFQHLHEVLLDQQVSILKGNSALVSESNEQVEQIVHETQDLEAKWKNRSRDLSQYCETDGDMRLQQIIPLVELKYASRLEELREILQTLMAKVHSTNKCNKILLERSVRFVERYIHMLTGKVDNLPSYGPNGRTSKPDASLFHGVG